MLGVSQWEFTAFPTDIGKMARTSAAFEHRIKLVRRSERTTTDQEGHLHLMPSTCYHLTRDPILHNHTHNQLSYNQPDGFKSI